jgi:hypothetical protein
VSRARTRYIYRNSMELSRKKITHDFRLTEGDFNRNLRAMKRHLSPFDVVNIPL